MALLYSSGRLAGHVDLIVRSTVYRSRRCAQLAAHLYSLHTSDIDRTAVTPQCVYTVFRPKGF